MSNGLQTFMRMANLYNPYQMQNHSDMPSSLPAKPTSEPSPSPALKVDEEVTVGPESTSTLEAFRRNVLNPPMRTGMTYPKNTLAGLEAALQIAATPTDYEQNRVYIDGNAYQQGKVYTDPKTGQKKYITPYKQPSFASQVLKTMPAAISPATDILNQEYVDRMSDWEMMNKGFKEAIGAESAMALTKQREAQAGAIPITAGARATTADARMLDAQTRQRLASLKNLTDSEKIRLLQEGKVSLEELKAANQYTIQELRGEQAIEQIGARGEEARRTVGARGVEERKNIGARGTEERRNIETRGGIARDITRLRGEEARKTKATPGATGASAATYPTQQRVAMQAKTYQIVNEHPEWADFISINEEGFPEIEPPSWYGGPDIDTYNQIYQAIYGSDRGTATPTKAPATQTPTKPAPKSAPKPAAQTGSVEMITPDGKATRMVPAASVELAKKQGYKVKG